MSETDLKLPQIDSNDQPTAAVSDQIPQPTEQEQEVERSLAVIDTLNVDDAQKDHLQKIMTKYVYSKQLDGKGNFLDHGIELYERDDPGEPALNVARKVLPLPRDESIDTDRISSIHFVRRMRFSRQGDQITETILDGLQGLENFITLVDTGLIPRPQIVFGISNPSMIRFAERIGMRTASQWMWKEHGPSSRFKDPSIMPQIRDLFRELKLPDTAIAELESCMEIVDHYIKVHDEREANEYYDTNEIIKLHETEVTKEEKRDAILEEMMNIAWTSGDPALVKVIQRAAMSLGAYHMVDSFIAEDQAFGMYDEMEKAVKGFDPEVRKKLEQRRDRILGERAKGFRPRIPKPEPELAEGEEAPFL